MKLNYTIGITPREHVLYHDEKGQFSGNNARTFLEEIYFLMHKFNVSFVSLNPEGSESCNENGQCNGKYFYLQSDSVDYVGDIYLNQLASLPINITFGTLLGTDGCHLAYSHPVKTNLRSEHFVDLDNSINYPVLLSSILFSLALIMMIVLINRLYHNQDNTVKIWNLLSLMMQQFYIPFVNTISILGLSLLLFIFFITTLFSATLQTGLIKSVEYERIETLSDLLHSNRIPKIFDGVRCLYPIKQSNQSSMTKINSILSIVEAHNAAGGLEIVKNQQNVLILQEKYSYLLKGGDCLMKNTRGTISIHVSKDPIVNMPLYFIASLNSQPEVRSKSIKYAHRVFEAGIYNGPVIKRIIYQSFGLENYYSPCLQSKLVDDRVIESLNMEYFNEVLVIGFIGTSLAIIVFVCERVLKKN